MKTKFLWGITGLVLVFLSALSGCGSPVSEIPTKELKPLSVPAPAEVKAIAYEGLNIVTWTPVSNVVGYRVYRQDKSAVKESLGVAPLELTLPSPSSPASPDYITDLYYVDTVSFTNQLVNDHDYVYYVEAVSGISTAPGRAVGSYDPADISEAGSLADAYLQNSELKGSNTIKAMVPERNGEYDWIDVAGVELQKSATEDGDYLIVTWPAKPNLKYTAKYTWGRGEAAGIDPDKLDEVASASLAYVYSPFNSVGYVRFPASGGTNSVTIYANFAGGDEYFNKKAGLALDAVYPAGLAVPGSVSAVRTANQWVKLTWTKVAGAAAYKVYRVETVASTPASILGDWALVTGSYDLNLDSTGYILYDRTAELEKGYRYLVVAEKTEGAETIRSLPGAATIAAGSALNTRPSKTTPTVAWQANGRDLKVSWTAVSDVEYALYRGAAVFKNEDTGDLENLVSYDYATETAITLTEGNYLGSQVVVIDTLPAAPAGKAWLYRLVTKQYGLDSESAFVAIPLPGAPDISSGSDGDADLAKYYIESGKVQITWDVPEEYLAGVEYILTRAEIADSNPSGISGIADVYALTSAGYVGVGSASGIVPAAAYTEGRAVIDDEGLLTRHKYVYKLVARQGSLVSDPVYVFAADGAYGTTTDLTIAADNTTSPLYASPHVNQNQYQAAHTIRLKLDPGSTFIGDNPVIHLYKRLSSDPETSYAEIPAADHGLTFADITAANPVLYWIDPGADSDVSYTYKVVLTSADGSIKFTNTDTAAGVAANLSGQYRSGITFSGPYGGNAVPGTGDHWYAVDLSTTPAAYLWGTKVAYRVKDDQAAAFRNRVIIT